MKIRVHPWLNSLIANQIVLAILASRNQSFRAMKVRLRDGSLIALRAIAVSGFVGAFVFALVLSVAPQLHERLHQPSDATHQCVVTLLTAGNCEYTPIDTIETAPQLPQPSSALFHRHFQLVSARLEFSLLEHAPPATS